MTLNRLRRRLQINRLETYGHRPPLPRPDRITRIGNRDGASGLWEVLHPDGSTTLNGVKAFNTLVPYGTPVLGIPREDGLIALCYRSQERVPEDVLENPYQVVALLWFAYETGVGFNQTNENQSPYFWLKVGDNLPIPLFDWRVYRSATEWQDGEVTAIFGTGLPFWSYLGGGTLVLESFGGSFSALPSARRDVLVVSPGGLLSYYYAADDGVAFSNEGQELISYPVDFAGYEGWLPVYKWIPSTNAFGWFGVDNPSAPGHNVPYYGEQDTFCRQWFGRAAQFPAAALSTDAETTRNPLPQIGQAGTVRYYLQDEFDRLSGPFNLASGQSLTADMVPLIGGQFSWNVGRSLKPYLLNNNAFFDSGSLFTASIFRQRQAYSVFSRSNNELHPREVGQTAPFQITLQDLLTLGLSEAQAGYYTGAREYDPLDAIPVLSVITKATDTP